MSFESEWAEIKRDSAVRMNLASAEGKASPFSGAGDLRADRQSWKRACDGVGAVRSQLRTALGDLEARQSGVASGAPGVEGLTSAGAHATVYGSWRRKLDLIQRECGELADKLKKSADAYYTSEEAIKEAFREQKTQPRHAPARGGE